MLRTDDRVWLLSTAIRHLLSNHGLAILGVATLCLAGAGCAQSYRFGVFPTVDVHGQPGLVARVTGAWGCCKSAATEARGAFGVVSAALEGGVMDRIPTGKFDVQLGVDFLYEWRRIGLRVGAFASLGLLDAGDTHLMEALGLRLALLPTIATSVPRDASESFIHHLGLELSVEYLFADPSGRTVFSFGPLFELEHFSNFHWPG
jgi:hypothetical protein